MSQTSEILQALCSIVGNLKLSKSSGIAAQRCGRFPFSGCRRESSVVQYE